MGDDRPTRRLLQSAIGLLFLLAPGVATTQAYAHGGTAHGSTADLVHACVGPKGQLRLVGASDDCLPSETPTHWANAAASAASASPLRIVDGNGNTVGIVVAPSVVGVKTGNVWLSIQLTADGFEQVGGQVYYATGDCTGTGYVPASPGQLFQSPVALGTTAYYATEPIELRPFGSVRWFFDPADPDGTCVGPYPPTSSALMGVAATLELSSLGTPPFSVAE